MKNLRFFISVLLAMVLFCSGCATIQKAKKAEELEREITRLSQLIKEKEERINELQELLSNQQRQSRERELSQKREQERLYKELNKLKTRLEMLEKREPALK